jgi:hypothetical protein
MDLIVSAEDYKRAGLSFDASIDGAKMARQVISKGVADVGTPWSADGMSKEFGQMFPQAMESLVTALGEVVVGLISLKDNFLMMADNAQAAEDANQS